MKKIVRQLCIAIAVLLIIGCGKDERLIQSETSVTNFFTAVQNEEAEGMKKYYPNIASFYTYYKSDSMKISDSKVLNDSMVMVKVNNHFTNGLGKKTESEIILYLLADSVGGYSTIDDSQGMTDQKEHTHYAFATKIGCITKDDTTDSKINTSLFIAETLASSFATDLYIDFITNVSVTDWSWKTGYAGSASGKGIVTNNSTFSIPNVKYKITYKTSGGSVVTTDDGIVSYDAIPAGGSKSFTFYTSYVGNATRATVTLEFDQKVIDDYILNVKEYTGKEYAEWLEKKPEKELTEEETEAAVDSILKSVGI